MPDKAFVQIAKEKLLAEKQRIESELREFAQKKRSSHEWTTRFPNFKGGNLEEEADEVEEYENLLPVESAFETKLNEINLALKLVETDQYGRCEKCREEISRERLEIKPEARFCHKCG